MTGPAAIVEQNSIHANATNAVSQGTVFVASASSVVQDNLIFGNSKPGISSSSLSFTILRNVIHDNTDGISTTSINAAGTIRDNRIYHNSQAGIRLTAGGSLVSGNSIYANATGILFVVTTNSQPTNLRNNLIYDHSSAGIEINDTSTLGSPQILNIHNNTFFEPTATAVRLVAGRQIDVRNNVLTTATGTLINVANAAQAGFSSDYNVFHVSGAGRVGVFSGVNLLNRDDWYFELGRDEHSIEADPLFIDIDGPDNHRGYDVATATDFGIDDDFRELAGSPAVDAGDPLSYYSAEPVSGNRVNVGAFGNTAHATASSVLSVQLVDPAGLSKFELGQAVPLKWISSGFSNSSPVALINAGGSGVFDTGNGRWAAEAFRTGGTTGTVTGTINTSLLADVPPASVLQTFSQSSSAVNGGSIRYDVPLPDGNYNIRLIFVEPTANLANQRKFDVTLQGQTVLANYDIFADTGGARRATAKSFTFTAVGGAGLQLELINRLASNAAIVSGIEITTANPVPNALNGNIEFSPD
ncbi:MAG: right-handed parallel beta-helix repeat-containing protein, partial [Planctomycetales bacterium]|nr:right-handed parallel beta-helix repeat-containing protein [Planctomycetales bacterium]